MAEGSAPETPGSLFIVWGPPHKGPRSAVLGRALGAPVVFLADTWRAGLSDPFKHLRLLWRTLKLLVTRRPRVVLVQSPPTLAVWAVALYAWMRGGAFLVDAHSDAFERARWTRPGWLNRFVARRAEAIIVTNDHWAAMVRGWGARALVVPDIPMEPKPDEAASEVGEGGFHLLVVNTWAFDEPLAAVVTAASELPEVTFHVTGAADQRVALLGPTPDNVRFTGFLPVGSYLAMMRDAHAVVCLTTRNNTMQRGACEALWLGRPIMTSDWPLLRTYFDQGTVHVDNTASGIRNGIRRLMGDYETYVRQVEELRQRRKQDWEARREELMGLLQRGRASAAVRRGSAE